MKQLKSLITYWAYIAYYFFDIKYKQIIHVGDPEKNAEYDARMFVLKAHHKCRQKYDGKPYYYHLDMVTAFALQFYGCINFDLKALFGALGHDLIEDVHFITYNNVVDKWGKATADIIYACTELRGKNRAERHGPEYYVTLQDSEIGSFVKICDVIANMTQGTITGSGMLKKYRKDYPKFKQILYKDNFKPMFDYIEEHLLTDKPN